MEIENIAPPPIEIINKQDFITLTLAKQSNTVVEDIRKFISLENAKKFEDSFKCCICSDTVYLPEKCEKCQNMACQTCVGDWTQQKNSCPNCRAEPYVSIRLSPFEKSHLNNMEFNCFQCSETFTYENSRKHAINCQPKLLCPAQCGTIVQRDEAALTMHLNECPNVVQTCNCCIIEKPKFILRSDETPCARKLEDLKNQQEAIKAEATVLDLTSRVQDLEFQIKTDIPEKHSNFAKHSGRFVDESFGAFFRLQPGDKFKKQWVLKNDGNTSWPKDTLFIQTNGSEMGAMPVEICDNNCVQPGEEYVWEVEFTAPYKLGRHTAHFRMVYGNNNRFGHMAQCDIFVEEESFKSLDSPQKQSYAPSNDQNCKLETLIDHCGLRMSTYQSACYQCGLTRQEIQVEQACKSPQSDIDYEHNQEDCKKCGHLLVKTFEEDAYCPSCTTYCIACFDARVPKKDPNSRFDHQQQYCNTCRQSGMKIIDH